MSFFRHFYDGYRISRCIRIDHQQHVFHVDVELAFRVVVRIQWRRG